MWLLEHAVAVNGCQCWMEAVRFAGTATAEASIALTSTSSNKGDSVGGGGGLQQLLQPTPVTPKSILITQTAAIHAHR